jgi:hypothetical protein
MTDFSPIDDQRLLDAEAGLHILFTKAVALDEDPTDVIITHQDITKELRQRGLIYEPLAKSDGHAFLPVRNICRSCRQPGPPAHDGADHDFVPVRNVCKGCGQGVDAHKDVEKSLDEREPVCKALGEQVTDFVKSRIVADPVIKAIYAATDVEAITKALPELSTEQRQQMAETGIAMPDGSFPIPDEAHLHAAIRLVGQAPDPQSAMNHIIERAKAMGMEDALPPAWNTGDPSQTAGQPQVAEGAHSLQVGKPKPAQSSAVSPTPGAGLGGGAGSGGASKPGTGFMKKIAKAIGTVMGGGFDEAAFEKAMGDVELDETFEYAILKSRPEKRITLGPVYMPDTLDAHGEWATADDLEDMAHEYFKSADHSVYLQHSDQKAGEIVSMMPWPNEVGATMMKSVDGVRKSVSTKFPAGTVYAGVQWEPWAWEMVKSGKITGFSMGGFSRRLEGAPVAA